LQKVFLPVLGVIILALACSPSAWADSAPSNLQINGGAVALHQVTGDTLVKDFGVSQDGTNSIANFTGSRLAATINVPEPSSLLLLRAGLLVLAALAGRRLLTA
jgi:hypothetical protein